MLDLVVYGASGFTGRLICSYLRRHAPPSLRWALAGRDATRLEQVAAAAELEVAAEGGVEGAPPCSIIAGCDAGSAAGLLSGNTRCVLSAAGPFLRHSDSLVRACARSGTHYVDINGEVPWVRRVIERDHEEAVESGAIIVPMCGFDSMPSDLGALVSAQSLAAHIDEVSASALPSRPCRITGWR